MCMCDGPPDEGTQAQGHVVFKRLSDIPQFLPGLHFSTLQLQEQKEKLNIHNGWLCRLSHETITRLNRINCPDVVDLIVIGCN